VQSSGSVMLDDLRAITDALNRVTTLDQALGVIVHRVKAHLAVDVCSVYLLDAAGEYFVLLATDGLDPRAVGRVRLGVTEGLIGRVVERNAPVSARNPDEPLHFWHFPEFSQERYHAFLGVPIIRYRKVLGALVVRSINDRVFDRGEETFLVTTAAAFAGAIGDIAPTVVPDLSSKARDSRILQGIEGAPGIGIGTAILPSPLADLDAVTERTVVDIEAEEDTFRRAATRVQSDLRSSSERMMAALPTEGQAILNVYAMLLGDSNLYADIIKRIRAGLWAPSALRETIREYALAFEKMEDPYLRARAEDIRGVGRRLLFRLQSRDLTPRSYPDRVILVGEEVSVARIADVPIKQLVGIVCKRGSPYSHAAILARALGIPAVTGVADLGLEHLDGKTLLIDGHQGHVYLEPSAGVLAEFDRLVQHEQELAGDTLDLRDLPAQTSDGIQVALQANIGFFSDVGPALERGAEGVGLYRSEFGFMLSESFPNEQQQYSLYRQVLEAFQPRPVTIRTLDVGGDKSLPYFPIEEGNAFLGWRGIRLTLDIPGVFLSQLRALLRANAGIGNLRLLLPMINATTEVDAVQVLLDRARDELQREGIPVELPPLGVLIEVPSVLYQIPAFARRVDFFSIGTNDLTQYLLAVDRTNARVAERYQGLHPAVLRAIAQVVHEVGNQNKPLTVCGEIAGDPGIALLLLGMGVRTLGMASPSIPRVKRAIRACSFSQALALCNEVLSMEDPTQIRQRLNTALTEAGIEPSIRSH
jgi:phosphotransferase system, enzyme I, PtsP